MQNHTLKYLHLVPDSPLPELKGMGQFQAIIVLDGEVAEMSMWETARGLVDAGCMLALVWGKDCEAWREALEDAALEAADYEDVAAERAVFVTAHDDDELEEVFWYARHRAAHPALALREVLIVHIADAPRREELEAAYHDA